MEKEDEEKNHKVEGAVIPKGLVGGPEPTHEGRWDEKKCVDQGQPERRARLVASREQEEQGRDHVAKV